MLPRILPFACYMAFIALSSALGWWAGELPDRAAWMDTVDLWLYPVKTAVVVGCLIAFWSQYGELKDRIFAGWGEVFLGVGVGLVVYLAWVRMDWSWAMQGEVVAGYDPFVAGAGVGTVLAGIRLLGAAAVVPVMEELFWRSFVIRYIVSPQFETVRLGTFTIASFVITTVLFGVEHNLWLAGMMAGAAYTLLLYRTGRLWPCIVAHAVTNLALGVHVLVTGEWQWW